MSKKSGWTSSSQLELKTHFLEFRGALNDYQRLNFTQQPQMAGICPYSHEDFVCPLCRGVFNLPIMLNCKHNFCRDCIQMHWEGKDLRLCPTCRCSSSSSRPPINLPLKIAADAFKKNPEHFMVRPVDHCSIHNKEVKLFCKKDAELICVACTTSRSHANHECCSITEAASEIMKELTVRYNPLKKHLNSYEKLKESLEELEEYLQEQALETASEIKKEFEKLHALLTEKEKARLIVLQKERDRKTEEVGRQLEEVNKIIEELSDIINYIDPIIIADELSFLKECKEAIKRTSYIVPEPEYPSESLLDVCQYLGSLKHGVWKSIESAINHCHVKFDPNTAHPNLITSDELTTVRYGKKQQVPDNPERCVSRMAVLAAGGFRSGKHCWTVEVGDSSEWYIGVARESIRRKTSGFLNPTEGFWVIALVNEQYWAQTSPRTRLTVRKNPQRITVELDYEKGKVSFSDAAYGKSIYTFKDKFENSVFPYFAIGIQEGSTLRICPF